MELKVSSRGAPLTRAWDRVVASGCAHLEIRDEIGAALEGWN